MMDLYRKNAFSARPWRALTPLDGPASAPLAAGVAWRNACSAEFSHTTRAWVEAAQFATRCFVVYVGWTFDGIPVVWLLRRVPRSAGQAAPPAEGLHATTPRIGVIGRLSKAASGGSCPGHGC